ncbi:MAG: hypothetical protein HC901_00640 [Bdellovibrionaceae bacterium]|nr:hypothetical protein [Pseudobdellovibrionaceae bacterium]
MAAGSPPPRHARCARWIALGAAAISLAAIVTETPGQLLHPTLPDRLNASHLAGFLVAALFWSITVRLGRLPHATGRLLATGTCGLLCLAAWCALFPIVLEGPYGNLDPLLRDLWLANVTEVMPLISSWREAPARLCAWLFPMVAVGASLAWPSLRRHYLGLLRSPPAQLWLAAALVFTLLSFRQIRWVIYAEILWLFPYAHLMNQGLAAWQGTTTGIRRRLGSLLLILAFCGAYVPCYLLSCLLTAPVPSTQQTPPRAAPQGILQRLQ